MPHLDEGALHAWLDGGLAAESASGAAAGRHLQMCPDCHARLEEARWLRERTGEILAAASPRALPAPAFEVLVGSVGARRRRRFLADPPRLARAATVVLALAAGWIARQVTYQPSAGAPPAAARADREAGVPVGDSPAPTGAKPGAARPPAGEGGAAQEKERESPEPLRKPAAQEAAAPPVGQAGRANEGAAGQEGRVEDGGIRVGGEGGRVEGEEVRAGEDAAPEALAFRALAVPAVEDAVGCWRLSFGWPIGLPLPERIELRRELEVGQGGARVAVVGGEAPGFLRFRWLPLTTDSLSLEGVGERTLRLRLEAGREELRGTGRVWTAEGADAGGPVTARRSSCPE